MKKLISNFLNKIYIIFHSGLFKIYLIIFFKSHISEKNKLQEQIKKLSEQIEQQNNQYKSADIISQKRNELIRQKDLEIKNLRISIETAHK